MLSMPADRSGTFGDLPRSGLGDLGQAGSDPALPANFPEMLGVLGESLRCQLPISLGPLEAQIAPHLVSACGLCHQAKACGHLAAVSMETGCCCCCCCCRKSVSHANGRSALPALHRVFMPGTIDENLGKLVCQATNRA